MVMHARKHPRLNDGFYDRNDSHSYKDMDKYPSKSSYNDRDYYSNKMRDSPSYRRNRDESPDRSPRYHNKSSYIERTKEKLERRGSRDSPESQLNTRGRSSSDRSDSHYHYDRNHRTSREKEREIRKEKEVRNEIQKTALRVCGDWSEHTSSSGKRYYYNCKSEVSQWERPKEWDESLSKSTTESSRGKEYDREKDRDIGRHTKTSDDNKHSNCDKNERSYHASSQQKQSSSSISSKTNSKQRSSWQESSSTDDRERSRSSNDQKWTGHQSTREHVGHNDHHNSRDSDRTRSLSSHNGNNSSKNTTGGLSREHNKAEDSEDSKPTEDDMDISPGSTPSNSRPQSRTGTPIVSSTTTSSSTTIPSQVSSSVPMRPVTGPLTMLPNMSLPPIANALPHLINRMNDSPALQSNINHHNLTQQALQTLQKLQQALSRQASLAQQSLINQSPRTSPQQQTQTQQNVFTSPQHHSQQSSQQQTPQQQHPVPKLEDTPTPTKSIGDDAVYSPTSDHGDFGMTVSPLPSPSHESGSAGSQNVGVSSLAAAALKSTTVEVAPSLRNYYDERLIGHVTGWPSEMYEKQADHYRDEAHSLGSLLSTQVSCDLKRARSLVRITNIQSTLQEQRILFLRQQIEELERMKSGNSFMSS